jgi:ParB family transcriptional regulator, chromosome partitioning protein
MAYAANQGAKERCRIHWEPTSRLRSVGIESGTSDMGISAAEAELKQVLVDSIDRNPDNPRIVFRPRELEDLLQSIRLHGIQVPISVYRENRRYVLIDGERRWRCALKLNLKTVPALVQEKPAPLENLLLMFNIHALREQWDLLTVSMKLPKIVELLTKRSNRPPTESQLASETGLNRSTIRRCKLLMALPQRYKDEILQELSKPKSLQKVTEDLFIEMERSLTTVERAMPETIPDREKVRRVLLAKYKAGIINNRVHFRNVARIARADRVGYDPKKAAKELNKLFQPNDYSIEQAYLNSVGEAYKERDIGTRIDSLMTLIDEMDAEDFDDDVKAKLEALGQRIAALFG